jgi:AcrR family transcriptional regulator
MVNNMPIQVNRRSCAFSKRRRSATVSLLLDAAEAVIARKGYDRATMRDIAGEANCAVGTLYLYFRNKTQVVRAIMERHSSLIHEPFMASLAAGDDPLNRVRALTHVLAGHFERNPGLVMILGAAASINNRDRFVATLPPVARERALVEQDALLQNLRLGQKQGYIRQDVPAQSLADFVHILLVTLIDDSRGAAKASNMEQKAENIWRMITGGLCGAEAKGMGRRPSHRRQLRGASAT